MSPEYRQKTPRLYGPLRQGRQLKNAARIWTADPE